MENVRFHIIYGCLHFFVEDAIFKERVMTVTLWIRFVRSNVLYC